MALNVLDYTRRALTDRGLDRFDEESLRRRLREILIKQAEYPGRAPGGTGPTGLGQFDERGYREMLEEQKEAIDITDLMKGEVPQATRAAYSGTGVLGGPRRPAGIVSGPTVSQTAEAAAQQAEEQRVTPSRDYIAKVRMADLRRREAEQRRAEAEADRARSEATAESPVESAKARAQAGEFRRRRDVGPEAIEGERPDQARFIGPMPARKTGRFTTAGMTEGRQAREFLEDPNARAAMALEEREQFLRNPSLARESMIGERVRERSAVDREIAVAKNDTNIRINDAKVAALDRIERLRQQGRLTQEALKQEAANLRTRLTQTIDTFDSTVRGFAAGGIADEALTEAMEASRAALRDFESRVTVPSVGAGDRVRVVGPNGETGTVSAEEATNLPPGWKILR